MERLFIPSMKVVETNRALMALPRFARINGEGPRFRGKPPNRRVPMSRSLSLAAGVCLPPISRHLRIQESDGGRNPIANIRASANKYPQIPQRPQIPRNIRAANENAFEVRPVLACSLPRTKLAKFQHCRRDSRPHSRVDARSRRSPTTEVFRLLLGPSL